MRTSVIGISLAVAFTALPAAAQIYRWVDERGVINYASTPPAPGVRVTRLGRHDALGRRAPAVPPVPRPKLPPLPPPAASGPPGDVDRATIEALGRTLAARGR
jgi:hypothetical protein